jgi:hypothetical protein
VRPVRAGGPCSTTPDVEVAVLHRTGETPLLEGGSHLCGESGGHPAAQDRLSVPRLTPVYSVRTRTSSGPARSGAAPGCPGRPGARIHRARATSLIVPARGERAAAVNVRPPRGVLHRTATCAHASSGEEDR